MFWRRWREEREGLVLECLHPAEWRGVEEVFENFCENNPEFKKISTERIIKDLMRMMNGHEVEMNFRLKKFVEFDVNGQKKDFAVLEMTWRLTGNVKRKKVKKKKKIHFGSLLPQGT